MDAHRTRTAFGRTLTTLLALGAVSACAGQGRLQERSPTPAVDTTALRSHVAVLAHDSMAGRPTPSRELDAAASYVADRFREAGVTPGGRSSGFIDPYPLVETRLSGDSSRLVLGADSLGLGRDFRRVGGAVGVYRYGRVTAPLLLVEGPVEGDLPAILSDAIVLYDAPVDSLGRPERADIRSVFALASAGAEAVVYGTGADDEEWDRLTADGRGLPTAVKAAWKSSADASDGPSRSFYEIRDAALGPFLARHGVELAGLRSRRPDTLAVYDLGVTGTLDLKPNLESVVWPPNVVGVIPGGDPVLSHEHVLVMAHLDGLGPAPGSGEIRNGADDNASGVAVLLEVARVLAAAPPLARTVVLAAVTGEEMGLYGSEFLSERLVRPPSTLAAVINIDMVGRWNHGRVLMTPHTPDDRIRTALARAASSPEPLGIDLWTREQLDEAYPGQRLWERSDHIHFARRGIPTVFLFTGLHDDYHETTDDVELVETEPMRVAAELAIRLAAILASGP